MEEKLKHLEFIQGIITRLANNSFFIKGLEITILTAIIALPIDKDGTDLILIACLPVMLFWTLDAYYLWQERLYRHLYDKIRRLDDDNIDFSMKTNKESTSYFGTFFSRTLLLFYVGGLIIISLIHLLV